MLQDRYRLMLRPKVLSQLGHSPFQMRTMKNPARERSPGRRGILGDQPKPRGAKFLIFAPNQSGAKSGSGQTAKYSNGESPSGFPPRTDIYPIPAMVQRPPTQGDRDIGKQPPVGAALIQFVGGRVFEGARASKAAVS
jgi:hypothetical protein